MICFAAAATPPAQRLSDFPDPRLGTVDRIAA
jgi:hypothetical protein